MSAETDLIKLYSSRILALATDIPHRTRLVDPDSSAKARSPQCGSVVTVDINVSEGQITAFGQDVKACALGQASAAVVGRNIIGCRESDVQTARDALAAMLQSGGPAPAAPFEDLVVLSAAAEHKNRHASILLVLDATLSAFAALRTSQSA